MQARISSSASPVLSFLYALLPSSSAGHHRNSMHSKNYEAYPLLE